MLTLSALAPVDNGLLAGDMLRMEEGNESGGGTGCEGDHVIDLYILHS